MAVAFANTACVDAGCSQGIQSFDQLVNCLVQIGAIEPAARERVRNAATAAEANAALEAILRFRVITMEAFEALGAGASIPHHVLDAINAALRSCGCRREVVQDGATYRTRILFEINEPADLLMPLANALAETIVSVDPTRVKQCREERCTCYFIDTSKNRTRAWCSMDRCGNRAKVAAYYARSKRALASN